MSNQNGSSKSSTGSRPSSPLGKLWTLLKGIGEKEIGDLDRILNENKSLSQSVESKTKELAAKDEEIANLQKNQKDEISKLQGKVSALSEHFETRIQTSYSTAITVGGLRKEIAELEAQLSRETACANSFKSTLESVQQQLSEAKNTLVATKTQLDTANADLRSKERALEKMKDDLDLSETARLNDKNEFGLEELDPNELIYEFADFVESHHNLAKKFFLTTLPKTDRELSWDVVSASLRQSAPEGAFPKKMPYSDSVPSQYFRVAAAEMVIACKLSQHIFQRFYLPDSPMIRDEIKAIMDELYSVNPRREAIFRIQLLSGFKRQAMEDHIANVVQTAVDEVLSIVNPLLFTAEAQKSFRSELEDHYWKGVELWRRVQSNATRGVVENTPSAEWGEIEDYSLSTTPRPPMDQMLFDPDPDPIMSLFPCLRIDGFPEPLCYGYALWSNQNIAVAAIAEYNRNIANGHMGGGVRGGRVTQRQKRRESVVSNLSGKADDAPVSPKAISGAHFPFANGRPKVQGVNVGMDYT